MLEICSIYYGTRRKQKFGISCLSLNTQTKKWNPVQKTGHHLLTRVTLRINWTKTLPEVLVGHMGAHVTSVRLWQQKKCLLSWECACWSKNEYPQQWREVHLSLKLRDLGHCSSMLMSSPSAFYESTTAWEKDHCQTLFPTDPCGFHLIPSMYTGTGSLCHLCMVHAICKSYPEGFHETEAENPGVSHVYWGSITSLIKQIKHILIVMYSSNKIKILKSDMSSIYKAIL